MKRRNPLISVVVPVYNVEDYVAECIESILNQTYSNFELILVNDGSTDKSPDVVNSYSLDDRIKVVNQENQGLGKARNVGIEKSDSLAEYYCFIDSDDIIEHHALETLVTNAIKNEADIVQSGFKRINEQSKKLFDMHRSKSLKCSGLAGLESFFSDKEIHASACGKLFNSNLLKKHEIRFKEGIHYEDHPFIVSALKHSKIVSIIDAPPIYQYRSRKRSITKSFSIKSISDFSTTYDEIGKTISDLGDSSHWNDLKNRKFANSLMRIFYIKAVLVKSDHRVLSKLESTLDEHKQHFTLKNKLYWKIADVPFMLRLTMKMIGLIKYLLARLQYNRKY